MVGHFHDKCKNVKDTATQTVLPTDQRRGGQQRQQQLQDLQQDRCGIQREGMKSSSAVRRVKFAKTPAEGSGVCLKDAAEGGGQQQRVTLTPIDFRDNPQSPVPSPGEVSSLGSPEVGEVSSDYGNPTVAIGVGEDIMTSCVTSDSGVTSQSQQPESTQGTTAAIAAVAAVAAVAASVSGGRDDGVRAHESVTEH